MKSFLLITALLLQAPAPLGSIVGTVTVSGTSTPIADADIAILTPDGVLQTTTDAGGRYVLADVPVGGRTVLVRADGFFVESTTPGRPFIDRAEVPVIVAAGAPTAVPNVSMVPGGTVSGRVVDPQGKPLPFVRVQALSPEAGKLNSGGDIEFGSRMTDDRGEYRMFFVPPGEYVIRAAVQEGRGANPAAPPRPGEMQTLVSTLFPDATDMAQAGRVTVKSGEEVRGVDISVKMEIVVLPPPSPPKPGFRVSGLVIDGLLPRVGTGVLLLGPEVEAGPPFMVGTVIIGATPGVFEIPSVPPGRYDLFVRMGHEQGSPGPGGGVQAWGRTTVEVRDQDVDGIRMTVHASVDVPGVVKIDGKPAPADGSLKIGLSPTGTAGRIANYRGILDRTQSPGTDGKVTIPRAAEGNYQVFMQGGENLYLADVRQGDNSILAGGIDVLNVPPEPFEVLLLSDGGTVEGAVSNTDKSPAGGSAVILIPTDKQMLRFYRTGTSGADGRYLFRGVRPGEYRVAAVPPGSLPPDGLTPEFLSGIESRSVGVTVNAGSSTVANIEAIAN